MEVDAEYCYLTTTGRRTGEPHIIEIWFAAHDSTIYLLSGGRETSDWVRNLMADPSVSVRIDDVTMSGHARLTEPGDEEERARKLVTEKYQPGYGEDLSDWRATALPIAIDLRRPAD